ncbi:MAG: hypothetical protein EOP04_11055 [Proteobacteria bacterium]|nr:MAG: hypothetical protein EOP04_11055 [Pseudomonadota bacterium]
MRIAEGKKWIEGLRIKLIALYFVNTIFLSLAAGMVSMLFAGYFGLNDIFALLIAFILVFGAILMVQPTWRITTNEVANYLNSKFPELEESASLFFKHIEELSLLEKFQLEKMARLLPISNSLNFQVRRVSISLGILILAFLGNYYSSNLAQKLTGVDDYRPSVKENVLPEVVNFSLKIIPPNYTGNGPRSQHQFSLKTEVGSQVFWQIKTNKAVKKLQLIFNDNEVITLDKTGEFSKIINQSGFYQLLLDGKKSDLYPIEIIPDLPIRFKITNPKPHTTIDIGQAPKVAWAVHKRGLYPVGSSQSVRSRGF